MSRAVPLAPVGQLAPQPWMTAPETQAVIAALTAEGAEARFVGGCVRDAVLKRPIKDVDIATHDPPETVMLLLEKAGIRAVPTGIEHGTVTAVVGRAHYEITTLRHDVETFGRHARVEFTDDWAADAARRDFTINALFCDPSGRVYDPFKGLQDLGAGVIRFVGEPIRRLREDVLRLLRYFRFYAHYGKPPADAASLAACRAMAHELRNLSGERVSGEIIKLLLAPDPTSVLVLMHGETILGHILPEAQSFGRLRVLIWLETRALVRPHLAPDPIRRLAAMLQPDRPGAEAVAERLKLSNAQTRRLVLMAAPPFLPVPSMDERARRRVLRRLGADDFRDLVLLSWAGHKAVSARAAPGETDAWIALLDEADSWQPVELPVRGQDLIDMGIPRGPEIGRVLDVVEQWWEQGDYRATRDEALAKVREIVRPA